MGMQIPLLQVSPDAQSLAVQHSRAHVLPHALGAVDGHWHVPFWHVLPPVHGEQHCEFATQLPLPHAFVPLGHVQLPLWQICVTPHWVPQPPQWFLSVLVSTQVPLQLVRLPEHVLLVPPVPPALVPPVPPALVPPVPPALVPPVPPALVPPVPPALVPPVPPALVPPVPPALVPPVPPALVPPVPLPPLPAAAASWLWPPEPELPLELDELPQPVAASGTTSETRNAPFNNMFKRLSMRDLHLEKVKGATEGRATRMIPRVPAFRYGRRANRFGRPVSPQR